MCKDCNDIDHVIFKRNGANQEERFNSVLDPKNLELHDFDTEDWLLFAYNFAKHVNFFNINDSQIPFGNWQEIFNHFDFKEKNIPKRTDKAYIRLKENISKTLENVKAEQNLTPHITLFVCFLKILELSKKRLNLITKKHLDFFYQEILQIEKLPAQADKVHILFELAQKNIEERISAETEIDAGKDPSGKKRIYKTTEEIIANRTSISHLKSVYNDINRGEIKCSEIANSIDGKGGALKEEAKYWFPFGYTSDEENYTELQDAKVGFAIASELFNLQEGERNITITITFNELFDAEDGLVNADLLDNISVFLSGEKNWLGSFTLISTSKIAGNQLQLVFLIPKETAAIVNYNQKKLGEYFTTSHPIIRFLIKTENKTGHTLFRNLVTKTINTINVKIDVKEVKSLLLESDTGVLNAEKPFYPFTTQPIKDASFSVNYPEVFSKEWKNINFTIKWKNTPSSFVNHYFAYKEKFLTSLSQTIFNEGMFTEQVVTNKLIANQPEDSAITIESSENAQRTITLDTDTKNLIVQSDAYFKATLSVLNKEVWDTRDPNIVLFNDSKTKGIYQTTISVDNTGYQIDKNGPVRLTLNQNFLHTLYSKIYVLAILSENPETLIPNEAYTPLVESISFNYTAEENINLSVEGYESNRIQLFHEAPFGQKEEHSYLKKIAQEQGILKNTGTYSNYLVPDYCNGGEFYIGLKDAEITQQISLLLQILEGSENPNVPSFTGKQKVKWSVLCDNNWMSLDDDYILADGIDNFLKSGIVKFSIPKQATKTNTFFPTNTIWVRAKMHKKYNAVCKVIDIKTQAVTAQFFDNNNDASHLNTSLPAETITKLINRITQVKSITQPFNSFDGKPIESDDAYYTRISERLRHKNRAIALWDYEHLVLQEFSEIFRVKCLNHTSNESFLSPGDVTLVVIPDIVNKNVFDIYEPRVSTATLNKIKEYINGLNSMQVEATVINPAYEKVIVKVDVKFYPEFDENFYKKQLNEDITKFLSPWAFDTTKEIIFGIELYRSVVIEYIEKLDYVDYIAELEMAKYPDTFNEATDSLEFLKTLSPSSPKNILVSVKNHLITTNIKTCKEPIIETPETCQYKI